VKLDNDINVLIGIKTKLVTQAVSLSAMQIHLSVAKVTKAFYKNRSRQLGRFFVFNLQIIL